MEQVKIAVKGKANKNGAAYKTDVKVPEEAVTFENKYGLNLTLDNSLSKYANDPFFIEHAKKVDGKFAKNKS